MYDRNEWGVNKWHLWFDLVGTQQLLSKSTSPCLYWDVRCFENCPLRVIVFILHTTCKRYISKNLWSQNQLIFSVCRNIRYIPPKVNAQMLLVHILFIRMTFMFKLTKAAIQKTPPTFGWCQLSNRVCDILSGSWQVHKEGRSTDLFLYNLCTKYKYYINYTTIGTDVSRIITKNWYIIN